MEDIKAEQAELFQIPQRYRFSSKSQRSVSASSDWSCCFRYHKGTDFQANHNGRQPTLLAHRVVLDTTKVQIFKQITTWSTSWFSWRQLFQIPQRYRFSSKSQLGLDYKLKNDSCFRYHKGTDFQANHNRTLTQVFNQRLFQIPQRYRFSSKSQPCSG